MRLFIAIPIPPDIRRAVYETAEKLRAYGADGRFVPQGNYHVTMHFIGESDALADAAEAMHLAARDTRPFLLRLTDYGTFSGKKEHGTGYIGLTGETGELNALYESLEAQLWERGFVRGRSSLTPHITIARSVSGDEGFTCPRNEAFRAQELVLYESTQENGKIRYTALHRERFNDGQ